MFKYQKLSLDQQDSTRVYLLQPHICNPNSNGPCFYCSTFHQDALAHEAKLSMLFVGEAPLTVLAASPSALLESFGGLFENGWVTKCQGFGDVWSRDTVDGRNPANQLRLVVFPMIYKVSYIPGAAGVLPSTVWHTSKIPNNALLNENKITASKKNRPTADLHSLISSTKQLQNIW